MEYMGHKVFVVMPAYNEAEVLHEVMENLVSVIDARNIVVVNDGSKDRTGEIAESFGANVIHHRINRGLGAALKTGLKLAYELGADIAVTFDADGQHNPDDVQRMAHPIIEGANIVIGSRFLKAEKMPVHRKVFNWIGNLVTWLFHGVWVSDSQSGLRGFSREAIGKLRISANQMDVSSEFIKEAHRLGYSIKEVPIKPVYTKYSMSKGQSFLGGVKTLIKIALRKFM